MSRISAPSPAATATDLDHGEAWEREIDRRMEEVRTGAVETIPAEQVFAEIDADLARRARERTPGPRASTDLEVTISRAGGRERLFSRAEQTMRRAAPRRRVCFG